MNAEQLAAHHALNLPLWSEWVAYIDLVKSKGFKTASVQDRVPYNLVDVWALPAQRYYGGHAEFKWLGMYKESFQVGEDVYPWIP